MVLHVGDKIDVDQVNDGINPTIIMDIDDYTRNSQLNLFFFNV